MNRRPGAIVTLLLALLTPTLLAGCLSEDDPCHPAVPAGRIQGNINCPGFDVGSTICIWSIDEAFDYRDGRRTEPALSGFYCMDLPPGDYVVGLRIESSSRDLYYTADGAVTDLNAADTLHVRGSARPVEADFDLSTVRIEATVSNALNNLRARIELHRIESEGQSLNEYHLIYYAYDTIMNGTILTRTPGVLAGDYRICVELEHYTLEGRRERETFWLPGSYNYEAAETHEIAAGELWTHQFDMSHPPGRLEGRVDGAWVEMEMDGPTIHVIGPDSTLLREAPIVDGLLGGAYRFDFQLPCDVKILVEQGAIRQWIGGGSYAEATPFSVEPGQTVAGADYTQSGLRIRIDNASLPLLYSFIELYNPDTLDLVFASYHYDNDPQVFGIANIDPGDYLLRVRPSDSYLGVCRWRPQWHDRAASPAEALTTRIDAHGDVTPVEILLERGGAIAGRVLPTEPGQYCAVVVSRADAPICWCGSYNLYDAMDATFEIVGLPDGDFKIGLVIDGIMLDPGSAPPDGTVWYPDGADWESAQVFEIRDASTIDGLEFDLR